MNRAVSKRLLWHFAFAASLTLAALFAAAARAQTDTLSHSVDGKQAWQADMLCGLAQSAPDMPLNRAVGGEWPDAPGADSNMGDDAH
ncbi:MAG: hypothetical protein RJB09_639 [Pseudomonadota bacterium]|jgi:hypothetical protein